MEWLTDNWGWVAAGVLGVALVYGFTKLSERKKRRDEAKKVLDFILGLMRVFEEVIADTVGNVYNQENRKKIAAGMMLVVMSEKVPLNRLAEKQVFEAVLVKSIKMLTDSHEITQIR